MKKILHGRLSLKIGLCALGAVIAVALTLYSGTHGIYLFDTGINYHMGWLIYNGWLPYIDFTAPLTPLCGLLTALGFKLFGVSYLSSVVIAAILSGSAYFVIWMSLQELLSPVVTALVSLTVVAGTEPVIGTLYYNHLAQLFVVVLVAQLLRAVALAGDMPSKKHSHVMMCAYLTTTALAFTKLHMGCLYGIAAISVDAWVRMFVQRQSVRSTSRAIGVRLLPCIVLVLCFLAWLRFNLGAIAENLFHTAKPTMYWSSISSSIQDMTSLFDMPHFTPGLAALAIAILTICTWRAGLLKTRERALLLFALGIIVIQELLTALTAETVSIGSGVTILALIAGGLAMRFPRTSDDKKLWRAIALSLVIPLTLLHLYFSWTTIHTLARKSWDEGAFGFSPPIPPALVKDTKIPFFSAIRMRSSQVAVFDYCYELVRSNPTRTVFFGPELEMFYAATGTLPPRQWPLWFHPGVSVNPDNYSILAAQFAAAPPDIVVLSLHRGLMGATPLEKFFDSNYEVVKNGTGEHWVAVFKHKQISINLPLP